MRKAKKRICPICNENEIPRKTYKTCGGSCAKELEKRTKTGTSPLAQESIEHSKDAMSVSLPRTRIHTLEELLSYCDVDPLDWEVEKFIVNKWEIGAKDDAGNIGVEPLYQVKAWLKKRKEIEVARKEVDALLATAKKKVPKISHKRPSRMNRGENLYEISLNDHHFGKLAWAPETGWADYDTKIAGKLFDHAIETLIHRAVEPMDKIVLVVGNDLLHIDNLEGTTTAGTRQDVDSRYHKVFQRTREVIRQSIDRLVQVAPVSILTVPGNHDTLAAWHMGDSLSCLYEGSKYVTVDASPNHKKFIEWGDVLIMETHGDRVKRKAETLMRVMSVEHPGWSAARWREIHLGHFHRIEAYEENGIRVRVLPSLCATDYWHAKSGYGGAQRASEAFLWSKKDGLLCTVNYNIPKEYERNV